MKRSSVFSPTNTVAKCRECGKATHSSIDGNMDIRLCRPCYDAAGLENEHSDGYHDGKPNSACPDCKKKS